MTYTQAAVDLIKSFEGCVLKAYTCPAGKPTIGYGSTEGVRLGMTISRPQAEQMLSGHLAKITPEVAKLVKTKLSQNQFDAVVSFVYNVGVGNFKSSTMLRLLNSGDISGAAAEFPRWNKADGKELPGLTRRRKAEQALFGAESSLPSS